ncbi:MAG: NADH-quinone oxidoreductase subunit I [Deltaproteobacteria bacterium]|nr:NADH-quinone oxidoreductase subunit I [Deltaproteobacteria bacterium]MBW1952810.1 NADH-quinone oxidoreductase subunit I [Deltaproteobacteria bacterium]MBW1987304.1 NADH-quinone oxidoreductase subunit I [Deltaproteobacteria bacterium]MBW2135419.1 NADH-quinone oxidoreductase subunit I [Deltaproteobacteria bacterium]
MVAYCREILVGLWSLLAGMAVTIRYFVKPIVTVQYPRERLTMSPKYRGPIELIMDPETGTHSCTACGMCVRTCPSSLITVEGVKVKKKKLPVKHVIDFSYCSLCGLCVEVCPTHALRFSNEYRLAGYRREDMVIDLLARLDKDRAAVGLPPLPVPTPEPEEAESTPAEEKA